LNIVCIKYQDAASLAWVDIAAENQSNHDTEAYALESFLLFTAVFIKF
jgi:hypothetical protein